MASLWTTLFLSVLGAGYFVYGRRQKHGTALFCGVGLMVAPYFSLGTPLTLLLGLVLAVLPFVGRS